MSVRFDDIGNRLRAFRLGSGLSAEEIARRAGISRTALYRFEKGEVVKIDTLEKLAELLQVSITTLLGVGIEYIASAVSYFERMRQIEERAEHIVVLAGPISFLLASDSFEKMLETTLRESIPEDLENRDRALDDVARILNVLRERKISYRQRRPSIVNMMSALEMERFVRSGMVGHYNLPEAELHERRMIARAEIGHFAKLLENEPIGIQIGIVAETLPQSGFQIFRQPEREILTVSPFRLGEHPNIRVGVAMVTSAPEALALHHKVVDEMWKGAMKGSNASRFLRDLLERTQPRPVLAEASAPTALRRTR